MGVFSKMLPAFASVLDVPEEQVTMETTKEDVENWDSLNQLNLVMELESLFGISFSLDEIAGLNSVRAIVETIERKADGR